MENSNTKKSSLASGFSWAEEVEMEEEREIEQAAVNAKSNPFGAARPREVVLEEKGVDWRKLDQEIEKRSLLRGKTISKENFHSTIGSIKRKHSNQVGEFLVGNDQETENSRACPSNAESNTSAFVRSKQQKEILADVVPPSLRYLPKNFNTLIEEIHKGRGTDRQAPNQDDVCTRRFACISRTVKEIESKSCRRMKSSITSNQSNLIHFDEYMEHHHSDFIPNNEIEHKGKYVDSVNRRGKQAANAINGRKVFAELNSDSIGPGHSYRSHNEYFEHGIRRQRLACEPSSEKTTKERINVIRSSRRLSLADVLNHGARISSRVESVESRHSKEDHHFKMENAAAHLSNHGEKRETISAPEIVPRKRR